MKIEILKCDRCGTSAETDEEKKELGLGRIILGFTAHHSSYSGTTIYVGHKTWEQEWCRKCRKELGILEDEIRKNPDAPVPSLEDMIREIVRSEIPHQN